MVMRISMFLLATVLALPIAILAPPAVVSESAGSEISAEANKRSKKNKKDKFKTVTTTVRQPLTQIFTNPALIDAPDGDIDEVKPADLYPSQIEVAGFANGTILDVDVILQGFTHDVADDADILLTATQLPGRHAVVMSDTCGELVTNLTLTLDDEAASPLSGDLCQSGTFQPTNRGTNPDTFPAPGPGDIPPGSNQLSVFDGGDPNGTWQLFVVDDIGDLDPGSIDDGWSLRVTAEVDIEVQEKVKIKKDKKRGGKKGKGRR